MSAAAAEQQQRQGETDEEEVVAGEREHRVREQRSVHPAGGVQLLLLHVLRLLILLFFLRLLRPRRSRADQHLYLRHRPGVVYLEPGAHLSGPGAAHAARPGRPHQRLLHAALRVVLHHRGDAVLPGVLQPDGGGVQPGLPGGGVRFLLRRRGVRLVPGAHALPPPPAPPAPAQPHDRQLHVRTPAPPHQPDVRAPPPPPPPPVAPPPGVQRARPRLQLHRLSGLQRADGGFGLETQLQHLRLFGLQRPGVVAFPSAVTSCVCLLLCLQRSILFVVGGLFFEDPFKLTVETF